MVTIIKVVKNIVIVVSLVIGVLFLYMGFKEWRYSLDSKAKNDTIKEVAIEDTNNTINRKIDFDKLKSINKDIVGWIYIPDTSVDYPILIGDSDDEYLYKDIERNYNPLGCIFSYSNTNKNLSDSHIKLFGHNMREFQMFGELREFLKEDYMKSHRKFYIYTENKALECDIASIFTNDISDTFFSNTDTGSQFLETLSNRNKYSDYDLKGNIKNLSNSQVFSLITCHGVEGTPYRLILNGIVTKIKY